MSQLFATMKLCALLLPASLVLLAQVVSPHMRDVFSYMYFSSDNDVGRETKFQVR